METHVKVVGILNIVLGVVGLAIAILISLIFGGVAGLVMHDADPDAAVAVPIIGLTGAALVTLIVATSLPGVIIGWGLYKLRPWSRIAGIVLSIVSLIWVPIGTAVGAYGLWVLFSKEGQRLFETGHGNLSPPATSNG